MPRKSGKYVPVGDSPPSGAGSREKGGALSDAAFLSLARRLGNPIAERPDAIGLLELVTLTRAFQAGPSWRRVQLSVIAWIRRMLGPARMIAVSN